MAESFHWHPKTNRTRTFTISTCSQTLRPLARLDVIYGAISVISVISGSYLNYYRGGIRTICFSNDLIWSFLGILLSSCLILFGGGWWTCYCSACLFLLVISVIVAAVIPILFKSEDDLSIDISSDKYWRIIRAYSLVSFIMWLFLISLPKR